MKITWVLLIFFYTTFTSNGSNISSDLENWMGNLDFRLRQIPIINLAIPGSHDAMTYSMTKKSKVAPDAPDHIVELHKVSPNSVVKWSKTQEFNVTQQLKNGVRYFDIRISLNKNDGKYYFVHGLYCDEIIGPLQDFNDFLNAHPKEVVVFDFQHFYEFAEVDHENLEIILTTIFGGKFYRRTIDANLISECTLAQSFYKEKQIIAIYRSDRFVTSNYWYSSDWPTPWPNVVNVTKLENYLEQNLQYRNPNIGHVSQCVLTPDAKFITTNLMSSLKTACAENVQKNLAAWIQNQEPGPFKTGERAKVNVFLADFIEINNTNFCKMVVDLNSKILKENI